MPEWLHSLVSALAVLFSGGAAALSVACARRSAPGIVARAAAQLEAIEADLDVRLRRLEGLLHEQAVHVENVLSETEKAAVDAGKRQKAARRAEQAAEARDAQGQASGGVNFGGLPIGHPSRIIAIENAIRNKGK